MRYALLISLWLVGCAPPLADEPWRITGTRVLAVRSEPAEAAPGSEVTLDAWVAAPDEHATPALRWSACETPTPFGATTTITPPCWDSLAAAPASEARARTLRVPADACTRFGAEAGRPPDATGGWYWSVALEADEQTAFAAVRLTCRPGSVPLEVAQAWQAAWKPNENPRLEVTALSPLDALTSGQTVELVADWSSTPEETYPLALPGTAQLDFATERYDVAWFVTGDLALESARTGGRVRVSLPTTAGTARVWAVLRDGRGGVSSWTASLGWR